MYWIPSSFPEPQVPHVPQVPQVDLSYPGMLETMVQDISAVINIISMRSLLCRKLLWFVGCNKSSPAVPTALKDPGDVNQDKGMQEP